MSNLILIENRIFTFRDEPVMIDRDLAEMYQVETKVLNQAVKRNLERFPQAFRFQLSDNEKNELVTNCDRFEKLKHSSNNPYAFTEQGVAMLSAVLRSQVAIQVSIQIMNAFVQMRKTIGNNLTLLQLSQDFKQHKLETDSKFEQVFQALEAPEIEHHQGVFFDGQTYDAYDFVSRLIKNAKQQIIVIDNYLDDSVITQLTKKKKDVDVLLLSKTISKKMQLDIAKASSQYPTFKAVPFTKAHDRFLILDQKEVYHIGASLKDLGKKWFAFSKLETASVTILNQIKELI
ncbi:ORF6N domain-containing protein [Cytophaga sp. FL35]|uniref:ORF6N domain-containing protein n=1 Tax=Cytophaga sp. FL35 TaxID=1904456 RepID=UPI0016535BD0|nr:ORF6N domain-containing protein [Cytophaga sp. FL35]MBC7000340.1 ORF6N domain-containing protein [Cytophaga sp. FL35]